MTKISVYPVIAPPDGDDLLIGTDVNNLDTTKNFKISDILALLNLSSYVPYTGATADVNLGAYSISTSGNAKLYDDGTVEGSYFQFYTNSCALQSAATASQVWMLPDASGTIALKTSATGSFTSNDGKTITVLNGIITSIV
jgi:hypothetical protein